MSYKKDSHWVYGKDTRTRSHSSSRYRKQRSLTWFPIIERWLLLIIWMFDGLWRIFGDEALCRFRAMSECSNGWRWGFSRWLFVGSLGVVDVSVLNCALSSSLRWKICCTSRSRGSDSGESLPNQCRRAVMSLFATAMLQLESCFFGLSGSLPNSLFTLRDAKSAATQMFLRKWEQALYCCHQYCSWVVVSEASYVQSYAVYFDLQKHRWRTKVLPHQLTLEGKNWHKQLKTMIYD